MNPGTPIPTARLDQRNPVPGDGGEPVCKHASGRAGTDDYEVEFHPTPKKMRLIVPILKICIEIVGNGGKSESTMPRRWA